EGIARRAAEMALDLGFPEFAAHGLTIGAALARFGGRIDEAEDLVQRVDQLGIAPQSGIGHLARSVAFSVSWARARGPEACTPPSWSRRGRRRSRAARFSSRSPPARETGRAPRSCSAPSKSHYPVAWPAPWCTALAQCSASKAQWRSSGQMSRSSVLLVFCSA